MAIPRGNQLNRSVQKKSHHNSWCRKRKPLYTNLNRLNQSETKPIKSGCIELNSNISCFLCIFSRNIPHLHFIARHEFIEFQMPTESMETTNARLKFLNRLSQLDLYLLLLFYSITPIDKVGWCVCVYLCVLIQEPTFNGLILCDWCCSQSVTWHHSRRLLFSMRFICVNDPLKSGFITQFIFRQIFEEITHTHTENHLITTLNSMCKSIHLAENFTFKYSGVLSHSVPFFRSVSPSLV